MNPHTLPKPKQYAQKCRSEWNFDPKYKGLTNYRASCFLPQSAPKINCNKSQLNLGVKVILGEKSEKFPFLIRNVGQAIDDQIYRL